MPQSEVVALRTTGFESINEVFCHGKQGKTKGSHRLAPNHGYKLRSHVGTSKKLSTYAQIKFKLHKPCFNVHQDRKHEKA